MNQMIVVPNDVADPARGVLVLSQVDVLTIDAKTIPASPPSKGREPKLQVQMRSGLLYEMHGVRAALAWLQLVGFTPPAVEAAIADHGIGSEFVAAAAESIGVFVVDRMDYIQTTMRNTRLDRAIAGATATAGDDVNPDLAALAPAVRSVVKSNPILGALAEIAQIVRSINAEDLTHTTQLRRVLTLASRALIAGAQSAGVPLTPAR